MQKFTVVGKGVNKKSGGKIIIRFTFEASSLLSAQERAKQEAEKRHLGYECEVNVE